MTDLERLKDILKDKKLRLTQARIQIFELLNSSDHSLSAKEIFEQISEDDQSTDLVSVYRNLTLFTELGLAHRFQDGRYSSCHHKEEDHHHKHIHIIANCTSCGKSSEVESHSEDVCHMASDFKKLQSPLKQIKEIVLQGLCSNCS